MIKKLLLGILVSLSVQSMAKCSDKPVRIAVVDTGFGWNSSVSEARLCKSGHKDFSGENTFTTPNITKIPVPLDNHGHGTNIVGIIEEYAKKAHINYCIIIIKYHSDKFTFNNLSATVKSFNYAFEIKADFVNYSSGGNEAYYQEREAVERYLNAGGVLVAAAGNESLNLDDPHAGYYPAKYDRRIIVVGSLDDHGKKLLSSNYGSIVNRWELGLHVTGYGLSMSGTSQATAIATGKLVSESKNKCGGK